MNNTKSFLLTNKSEKHLHPRKLAVYLLVFFIGVQLIQSWALASDGKTDKEYLYIALVGPMSGNDQYKGREMADSVNFYIDKVNAQGGLNGKTVKLLIFDDRNDSTAATQKALEIAADDRILLVIGHRSSNASIAGGKIYKEKSIPAITATASAQNVTKGNDWYFRVIFNNEQQGKYIANYVYHVLNYKIASIIYDRDAYGSSLAKGFEKATQTLGMTVNYKWSLNTKKTDILVQLRDCIDELSQKQNAGIIFLALNTKEAVPLIKAMKDRGMNLPLFGGDSIGQQAFPAYFQDSPMEQVNPGFYSDDIYTASYFISDTKSHFAGRISEEFRAKYKGEFNAAEMTYYDAISLGLEAIKKTGVTGENPSRDRGKIRNYLAGVNSIMNAFKGVAGPIYFDKQGDAQKTVPIGIFKKARLISAPVQLNPIPKPNKFEIVQPKMRSLNVSGKKKSEREYETEFLADRGILLIDGAYVQKTFLVYTGMEPDEISKPDFGASEFDMDFFLWFRYQQGIQPQHIEFLNAVEPIKLEKPVKEKTKGHIIYRKYHVKGRFKSDFLDLSPVLDQHILGTDFRHKHLSQNRLTYIVDVLGMPEYTGEDSKPPTHFLNPDFGWTVFNLRFHKDILKKKAMGEPEYLGADKGTVKYSRFNMAIFVKKNEMTLRRIIKNGVLNYVLLLAGIFFISITQLIGRNKKIKRFRKLTLVVQMAFTALFLISCEVMLLDVLAGKNKIDILKLTKLSFDILWWMTPAYFVNKVIRDLILIPNAERNKRTVPSLLIYFISFIIYILAIFGVIAFIFDQKLTSLLATSGVLAMIIGLAVQMNISNIFSGVALNLERPFRIGDWVEIGKIKGEVIDITWRTTRIQETEGNIISIPNSTAAESISKNYNYPNDTFWHGFTVYIDPVHDPKVVRETLVEAVKESEGVIAPWVIFAGLNEWAAKYQVYFQLKHYSVRNVYGEGVWENVWKRLKNAGIKQAVRRQEIKMTRCI